MNIIPYSGRSLILSTRIKVSIGKDESKRLNRAGRLSAAEIPIIVFRIGYQLMDVGIHIVRGDVYFPETFFDIFLRTR